ncbi:MAG: NUDIX hydrolase [Acidobacteriaceae bacterium]|nr:NUDIX hydrolase [Acidobacteriaceae bacterium]
MKRDYPDRPIVGVGAVIVEDGRALVVRRGSEPLKGEWSIPGGVLELGETLREGAAREALEETGLVVEAGEVLEVVDRIMRDPDGKTQYHFVLVDFLCRRTSGEACAGGDAVEVRWAAEEELDSLKISDAAAAIIRKALKNNTDYRVPGTE